VRACHVTGGRAAVAPVNDYDEIDSDGEEDDSGALMMRRVEELTGDVTLHLM
jgi:hypothetical protein